MRIASTGVCSSVGNNTESFIAAIKSRINNFQETQFIDRSGKYIYGAPLYNINYWGAERFKLMYESALQECLSKLPPSEDSPIIFIDTEFDQLRKSNLYFDKKNKRNDFRKIDQEITGKAGIGIAIKHAYTLLNSHPHPRYVIVIGADTHLDSASIENYLTSERIRSSDNSDGFIPGEGAGAIALTLTDKPSKIEEQSLWIDGIGICNETSSPTNGLPILAKGLTIAIRDSITQAGKNIDDYFFNASGVSGEQWFFKEAAIAMDRVMNLKKNHFPHRLISQSIGEVGSACGPLTLAWIGSEMNPYDNLGPRGLLHFSNENGLRTSLSIYTQ